MEFIQSPKLVRNDTIYSLIVKPRNVHEAKKFCLEKASGSLYQPKMDYAEVVDFAAKHDILSFYIGISDEQSENTFQYDDGEVVPKSNSKWHPGQPDNFIPELNRFCEPDGEDSVIGMDQT